jgi:hypothetical protein
MNSLKKPHILLDFNLLLWIPKIDLSILNVREPKENKFIRVEEQRAFHELLEMKDRKEIKMGMPNMLPKEMIRRLNKYPVIKEKAISFLRERKLLSATIVMDGSELDEKENLALDTLYTTIEKDDECKHDDPAVYTLAAFVKPGVTHLATCDMNFIRAKAKEYMMGLAKNDALNDYIKFLRRNKELIVDLPSKILLDLKKKL